jgi:hypothetical protein
VPNTNCLEHRQCPQCQQTDRFDITATATFRLLDDGTEYHGDVEYDEDNAAACPDCGWSGKWGETQMKLCMHCQEPVLIRVSDQLLVHADEDEDPSVEDYGWVQCSGGETNADLAPPPPATKQRFWASWLQPTEDYRAVTFPPNEAIIGYWCSGYASGANDEAVPILCAVVDAADEEAAAEAVKKDWPEWPEWRFIEPRHPDFKPGDRFPIESEWMQKRFNHKPTT